MASVLRLSVCLLGLILSLHVCVSPCVGAPLPSGAVMFSDPQPSSFFGVSSGRFFAQPFLTDVNQNSGLFKSQFVAIEPNTNRTVAIVQAKANWQTFTTGTYYLIYLPLQNTYDTPIANLSTIELWSTSASCSAPTAMGFDTISGALYIGCADGAVWRAADRSSSFIQQIRVNPYDSSDLTDVISLCVDPDDGTVYYVARSAYSHTTVFSISNTSIPSANTAPTEWPNLHDVSDGEKGVGIHNQRIYLAGSTGVRAFPSGQGGFIGAGTSVITWPGSWTHRAWNMDAMGNQYVLARVLGSYAEPRITTYYMAAIHKYPALAAGATYTNNADFEVVCDGFGDWQTPGGLAVNPLGEAFFQSSQGTEYATVLWKCSPFIEFTVPNLYSDGHRDLNSNHKYFPHSTDVPVRIRPSVDPLVQLIVTIDDRGMGGVWTRMIDGHVTVLTAPVQLTWTAGSNLTLSQYVSYRLNPSVVIGQQFSFNYSIAVGTSEVDSQRFLNAAPQFPLYAAAPYPEQLTTSSSSSSSSSGTNGAGKSSTGNNGNGGTGSGSSSSSSTGSGSGRGSSTAGCVPGVTCHALAVASPSMLLLCLVGVALQLTRA